MEKFKNCILISLVVLCFFTYPLMSMSRPTGKQQTEENKTISTLEKIWLPPDLSEEEKAEWKNGQPPG